jgi:hypothetical protein
LQVKFLKLRAAALRHVFGQVADVHANSERTWTIAPAEAKTVPPAVFLDGELERVRGLQEDTTMAIEMSRVRGGIHQHAATTAHRLRNVTLVGGRLFAGAMNHRMSQLSDRGGEGEPVRMRHAAVSSTLMGSIYFGHWMHDDLSLRLAAQTLAPPVDIARQTYRHEGGYRELLAQPEHRVARGRFDELILLQDWGQNAGKRGRFEELRARLRRSVVGDGNRRVYIKRGRSRSASGRDLLNAGALEAHLVAQGFVVVDPDSMAAGQIAAAVRDASLVVGVEGSHLAHAIYAIADRGTLLAIQPPHRFNNVFKDITDAMALRYAFIVGEPAPGGFDVDLGRLDRLIEKVAVD